MPGFFNKLISAITVRSPFTSSTGHRNGERADAATEVISSTMELLSPTAIIPPKLAQTAISIYSIFREDTHFNEKVLHGLQAGISATQMGLAITLLFEGVQCTTYNSTDLCKALFLCTLLYRGTLLVGWVPSELSKDPYGSVNNANPQV